MPWRIFLCGALLLSACSTARAIENVSTGTFNETAPTNTGITSWLGGWAQPLVQPTGTTYTTGWNYVGTIGSASGTYLGNGWVITCGHVGPGNFVLNGVTYPLVANSGHSFSANGVTLDFVVFQVSPAPALPALPIRQTDPVVGTSHVAMIGFGDGGAHTNKTWGYNPVNYAVNEATTVVVGTNTFTTNDAWIVNGDYNGSTADYQVEGGDSGGGDFIYNSTAARWELAGLNEAILQNTSGDAAGSAFVQLDTYATQLEPFLQVPTDTPAMPPLVLALMGGLLFCVAVPAVLLERK